MSRMRILRFIAREIFPLGLRIEERRTVPDGDGDSRDPGGIIFARRNSCL